MESVTCTRLTKTPELFVGSIGPPAHRQTLFKSAQEFTLEVFKATGQHLILRTEVARGVFRPAHQTQAVFCLNLLRLMSQISTSPDLMESSIHSMQRLDGLRGKES